MIAVEELGELRAIAAALEEQRLRERKILDNRVGFCAQLPQSTDPMYLRHLHIQNLKLLKSLELDLTNARGEPRMWTVIIGENGTGKTSILQSIAMAAAGGRHINSLMGNPKSLADKRQRKANVSIKAQFVLDGRLAKDREYPGYPGKRPAGEVRVDADVNVRGTDVVETSRYVDVDSGVDPIIEARQVNASLWFVAAYGVHRFLPPDAQWKPTLDRGSIDRLRPVFKPVSLIGTAFNNILVQKKATAYRRVLRDALFRVGGLLPELKDIELRGKSGDRALEDQHRFVQALPSGEMKLPASWLSHGYQSTIAWIADLVGHILWEAKLERDLLPSEMEGLVLIDELDLYLHPRWQRVLIRLLKATFPRLQFIATTHSPLALVGLRPDEDEIVRLTLDPRTGDVVQLDMRRGQPHEPDPRLMTGSEIYRTYFGIDRFYPEALGEMLREHRYLAANPDRSKAEEARLDHVEKELKREGVEPDFPREPRSGR